MGYPLDFVRVILLVLKTSLYNLALVSLLWFSELKNRLEYENEITTKLCLWRRSVLKQKLCSFMPGSKTR